MAFANIEPQRLRGLVAGGGADPPPPFATKTADLDPPAGNPAAHRGRKAGDPHFGDHRRLPRRQRRGDGNGSGHGNRETGRLRDVCGKRAGPNGDHHGGPVRAVRTVSRRGNFPPVVSLFPKTDLDLIPDDLDGGRERRPCLVGANRPQRFGNCLCTGTVAVAADHEMGCELRLRLGVGAGRDDQRNRGKQHSLLRLHGEPCRSAAAWAAKRPEGKVCR